jgi:hypothetical protein
MRFAENAPPKAMHALLRNRARVEFMTAPRKWGCNLNENAKKLSTDKFAKIVNDEELDNIAGGNLAENAEILSAMENIDPKGYNEALNSEHPTSSYQLTKLLFSNYSLIKSKTGMSLTVLSNLHDGNNEYILIDRKGVDTKITHTQAVKFLNMCADMDDF